MFRARFSRTAARLRRFAPLFVPSKIRRARYCRSVMELAAAIAKTLGCEVVASSEHRVSGGSINQCSGFDTASGPIFVKYGDADCLPVFEAEAAGLAELARADALRVPNVLSVSSEAGIAFLVLE